MMIVRACAVLALMIAAFGVLPDRIGRPLAAAEPTTTPAVLPHTPPPFRGTINLRAKDSTPDFPQPIEAPKGAPNVLLILLDDVGFGASSAFGGPCRTPVLEALAKRGLRYTQFHTTALCSPTRAALITGRNHHAVHSAAITEAATGFPGYDSVMQKDTATVAEVLKLNAWNTASPTGRRARQGRSISGRPASASSTSSASSVATPTSGDRRRSRGRSRSSPISTIPTTTSTMTSPTGP
jgi:hypothetical protein